ncbi:MAG: VOC family protein [Bacteroidetes bacterium]|jgi:predicted enzyme related to lactoylglutathione lyase|nr:VOC family protein [Bacteroidota bacterium]
MFTVPTWFEIPVLDLNRAKTFYHKVFGWGMVDGAPQGELCWALIEGKKEKEYRGALVLGPGYLPSATACLPYFACDDINGLMERIGPAGGRILFGPEYADGSCSYVHFMDTEGNRIGLVSNAL